MLIYFCPTLASIMSIKCWWIVCVLYLCNPLEFLQLFGRRKGYPTTSYMKKFW